MTAPAAVPRLLAAPDKFRGTATAAQVADAMAAAAEGVGWQVDRAPISDGGEGLVECLGGANRITTVVGPLGKPVAAAWRLAGDLAVLETAAACGLALVGGRNEPLAATARGAGQLVAAAAAAGARHILAGVGGSATTDGGADALAELRELVPLDGSRGVAVTVACDVRTPFLDAAAVFAPQKGADAAQVAVLTARLERLAERYLAQFGRDVRQLPGAGAGGGLAGGLAAAGASLRPGFDLVADQLRLDARIAGADLVLTGEGRFDATSLAGKGPGALLARCAEAGVPVVVVAGSVAGSVAADAPPGATLLDLTARFGAITARAETLRCVHEIVTETLRERPVNARR
ncbi:glycerate kinase [uncultured Jatrophihabitans sp.]|uniref:glycerate kinase n=1 Tax=uncultured Jatrophihabitans sp. TaxID=1610747 RepID=UPI0035CB3E9D